MLQHFMPEHFMPEQQLTATQHLQAHTSTANLSRPPKAAQIAAAHAKRIKPCKNHPTGVSARNPQPGATQPCCSQYPCCIKRLPHQSTSISIDVEEMAGNCYNQNTSAGNNAPPPAPPTGKQPSCPTCQHASRSTRHKTVSALLAGLATTCVLTKCRQEAVGAQHTSSTQPLHTSAQPLLTNVVVLQCMQLSSPKQ